MSESTQPGHTLLRFHIVWLMVLVAGVYFLRMSDLTIRGEESRRAQIASEMIWTGDWIVPRQQGEPYLTRPPLQNWAIALLGQARGGVDPVAVRLPSVIAILLTVLLVFAYARTFLSPAGALGAGAAFATMIQVMELGRLGESDAMLTLMVAGSLLLWHGGRVRGWPPLAYWCAGYALAAVGALVKGPQPPFYFAGPVLVYLLFQRRWRELLSWPHAAGIAVFLGIIAIWQVPFLLEMGWRDTILLWTYEVTHAARQTTPGAFLHHLWSYPLEIALGCLLPWSLLLLAFLHRRFRAEIGPARDHVVFLVTCLAVTAPSVWLVSGAQTRYFMALFPCVALLVGLVIDRSFQRAAKESAWRHFALARALVMLGCGAAVAGAGLLGPAGRSLAQGTWFAAIYAAICLAAAAMALWSRRGFTAARAAAGVLGVAAWLGVTYTALRVNMLVDRSSDPAAEMARIKGLIPDDVRLVSFDAVHHLFAYHYGRPIELRPRPLAADDLPPEVTWFCFDAGAEARPLPFAWAPVEVFSCDRTRREESGPGPEVIIGRRLPQFAAVSGGG